MRDARAGISTLSTGTNWQPEHMPSVPRQSAGHGNCARGRPMLFAPRATVLVASLAFAPACTDRLADSPTGPTTTPPIVLRPTQEVFVGAGDIAECDLPGAEATARLLDRIPGTVFTTGDHAYYRGSPDEFARCYEPTWGRHRTRTRPTPGNHDYETPGAFGYFDYFGETAAPAAPGFYSFDLGAWHIISLNSNIAIGDGSAQLSWLRRDLTVNRARCTLAFWHHPLFSSGTNGPDPRVRAVWDVLYLEDVEVVVNGHEHTYERFGPQHPSGRPDAARGIRQFVVGTGGAHLSQWSAVRPNSEARASVWGVLKLTLQDAGYTWEFLPVAGESFRDSGSDVCH